MVYFNQSDLKQKNKKGREKNMSKTNQSTPKYSEEFKKTLVTLRENGKSLSQLNKEYGVSTSALSKWCKQYTTVVTDEGEIMTAKQIKELQRRNAQLEEENIILKKRLPC